MSQENDPYNRSGFFAFIFSMLFTFAFFAYVSYVHPPVDLKEIPDDMGAPVDMAGGAAKKAVDISGIAKPWLENADMAAHGAGIYKAYCAVCHGPTGAGDGAAGAALNPKPRNFVKGDWKQGGSSIKLYESLRDGIPGGSMASFKHLAVKDRWAVVQYIRSITKNKVSDNEGELEAFGASAD